MLCRAPLLLALLLISTSGSDAESAISSQPEPLGQVISRRHNERWRELASFATAPLKVGKGVVITLTDDQITPRGLIQPAHLRSLLSEGNLSGIVLRNTAISHDGLKALVPLAAKLQLLDLYGTRIDDGALPTIGAFVQLRELDLGVTRVTAAGLTSLRPLVQLQVLDCDAGGELDGALEARQPGASVTIRCAGRANASCATSISADAWGCAARQS